MMATYLGLNTIGCELHHKCCKSLSSWTHEPRVWSFSHFEWRRNCLHCYVWFRSFLPPRLATTVGARRRSWYT